MMAKVSTAVNRERASPRSMHLRAVREHGRVVDFRWESVGSAAAHLLHCEVTALRGQCLSDDLVAGPLGHPALIQRYRRVLELGDAQSFEQVHRVDGRQDLVIHRVAPEGDGVTVTLTNLSEDRRRSRVWRRQSRSAQVQGAAAVPA